ncbi:glycerophosphocholine phosphodiesterase GPCPD1-like [Diadema setosum]|uniref:glycerophosphocholine phosphodiesterase GPCPD1-like n=1 Tax=Diadema setosum TaxID=31175 RepID=UPI003B3AE1EA
MPTVTFKVGFEARREGEVLCVTGNIPALGLWSARKVQALKKDEADQRWTLTIDVPENTKIDYRYAVCSFLKLPESKIVVHEWEAGLVPRHMSVTDIPYHTELQTFGTYDGQNKVQRGWLVDTREIQLMFDKSTLTELTSSLSRTPCSIRVTAVDTTSPYESIPILVANHRLGDHIPREQATSGEPLDAMSEVLTFSTQNLAAGHDVKFMIQLLQASASPSHSEGKRLKGETTLIGECWLVSSSFTQSVGSVPLHLFDNVGVPLGVKISVSYAAIEPLEVSEAHSFQVSYATHWKKRNGALNVGHRGMGRTMCDHSLMKSVRDEESTSNVPENTVYSLKEAAYHGADFVEFDVHVTKDGIPVLFHDFQFSLCMMESTGGQKSVLTTLPIKDTTYENLLAVQKLNPVIKPDGSRTSEFVCENSVPDVEDALPFSKLQTALERVPEECGFDIEIKYPMKCEKSGWEYEGTPMDMNSSLDAILSVVLKHGGNRRIFFSAFNPDMCEMIQKKQSKYPVMLCNFGPTDLYEAYTDPRSVTVERCILTAMSGQYLGLCGHCEDYLHNPALVEDCHSNGLMLACWGERTANAAVREELEKIEVDCIIHDSMGSFPKGTKNKFMQKKSGTSDGR